MLLFGYASTGSIDGWMSVGFFTMVVLFVFVSTLIEKKMSRDKQGCIAGRYFCVAARCLAKTLVVSFI